MCKKFSDLMNNSLYNDEHYLEERPLTDLDDYSGEMAEFQRPLALRSLKDSEKLRPAALTY